MIGIEKPTSLRGRNPVPLFFALTAIACLRVVFLPYRLSPALGRGNLSQQPFSRHGAGGCYGFWPAGNVPVSLPQNLDLAPEREVVFASEVLQKTELDEPLRPF